MKGIGRRGQETTISLEMILKLVKFLLVFVVVIGFLAILMNIFLPRADSKISSFDMVKYKIKEVLAAPPGTTETVLLSAPLHFFPDANLIKGEISNLMYLLYFHKAGEPIKYSSLKTLVENNCGMEDHCFCEIKAGIPKRQTNMLGGILLINDIINLKKLVVLDSSCVKIDARYDVRFYQTTKINILKNNENLKEVFINKNNNGVINIFILPVEKENEKYLYYIDILTGFVKNLYYNPSPT